MGEGRSPYEQSTGNRALRTERKPGHKAGPGQRACAAPDPLGKVEVWVPANGDRYNLTGPLKLNYYSQ